MILTGPEIANEVHAGRIVLDPFENRLLNPNSYNIRLGASLKRYFDDAVLDTRHSAETYQVEIPEEGLLLEAGKLYLGHTVEVIGSDFFVPFIGGRSSTGRLGLFVHITAPLGDIGYVGQWTLQLRPTVPVRVYPRQEIGQMFFVYPYGPIDLYKGKYQGGSGPQAFRPSELHGDRFPQASLDPYSSVPALLNSLPHETRVLLDQEATITARRAVAALGHEPIHVLDVGCGAGFLLDALERFPQVQSLVGVDTSATVLGVASERLSRTLLVRDDFLTFEFGQRRFSLVALLAFLHLFPKRHAESIMRRVRALLGPAGLVVASTSVHSEGSEQWEEKSSIPGSWRFRSRYTREEWRGLFSQNWQIRDEWETDEVMDPSGGKRWQYVVASAT